MTTSTGATSSFTRGWETLAHALAMLKVSLVRHAVVSVFLGSLATFFIFRSSLEPSGLFGGYLKASVLAWLVPAKGGVYAELDGVWLHHVDAARAFRALFLGRSLLFLLRQMALLSLFFSAIAFVLGTAVIVLHGRNIMRARRRRGAILKDARREAAIETVNRVLSLSVLAVTFAVSLTVLRHRAELDLLADHAVLEMTDAVPQLARWWSMEGEGETVWLSSRMPPGFYDRHAIRAFIREELGPEPLFDLVCTALVLVLGLSAVFGYASFLYRRRQRAHDPRFRLAGVPIPAGQEHYHVLVCGSPGSGKSTAIKDLLDQIRARGERAVVYDLSGEYVELYYREGKDKLLNPLDRRSEPWNLWAEIRSQADYTRIAKSLFPREGRDPFWGDASSVLFSSAASVLGAAGERSNQGLYHMLTQAPLEDLYRLLSKTPAARLLDPKAGAMPPNLLATVASKLEPWSLLSDDSRAPFSIRRFVEEQDSDGWLFLSTGEDQAQLLRPLLSLWADLASTALLSLPPNARSRIWCVLDEVASLQELPALPGLLERGRKHGAAVVLGLQAMPQLRDAYGRERAQALLSQPQTWLVLRTVEPDTAGWLEVALGHTEVEEAHTAVSMGVDAMRDGVSLQRRTEKRAVALAAEIAALPDFNGFLKLPGSAEVYQVAYAPRGRPVIAKPFDAHEKGQGHVQVQVRTSTRTRTGLRPRSPSVSEA